MIARAASMAGSALFTTTIVSAILVLRSSRRDCVAKRIARASGRVGSISSLLPRLQPEQARGFLRRGGELTLYHGFSVPSVTLYQSIWFYNGLARLEGGIPSLQSRARLFMSMDSRRRDRA
jgi:hypothetical protein